MSQLIRNCTLALTVSILVIGSANQGASAEEEAMLPVSQSANAEIFEGVESIEVWGIVPGRLSPVLGASVDQIEVDDFTAEGKSLADLLSDAEGVTVRRFGGPGDSSEVTIRGSSASQVVVTVDGIKANSILTGGLDLGRVCAPLLERIEITRGAGAAREGSGAVGGVVNLVSRAGSGQPTTRAAFEAGAFETYSGSLLHADRIGATDYTVGYCGFSTEGDFEFARPVVRSDGFETGFSPRRVTRLNNDRNQHAANLGLAHSFGEYQLRLIDLASYSSGGAPGVDGENGPTAGQATESSSRDLSNLVQLKVEGPSLSGWGDDFTLAVYHRYERTRFRNPVVPFRDPIDLDARLTTLGLRAGDIWFGEFGSVDSQTRISFDTAHDSLRAENQPGRDRPNVAGAIEEELGFLEDRLRLSAGVRVDWTDGFGPQALPTIGWVIEPLAWLRLRGQAGRAYRAPNFDELFHPDEGFIRGNPNLSPEDAWNIDGGIELDFEQLGPFSRVRLRATGFYRDIDESIIWILINPRTIAPINTGPAQTRGFEFSVRGDWTRFLGVTFNYTWTDSEREETGRRLAGQAEFELFARLRIGPEKHWKLIGEVQHTGEIFLNEGGSRFLPERTVYNLRAAIDTARFEWLPLGDWFKELWLYGDVENLSDEAIRDSISFPQPGRNASLGFEARW